jgi:adenylate cyclase
MRALLFIDDEEGVRRSIKRALKREPFETHTVASGAAGIDFVRAHTQNVATVISDYKMPGMDGLETLDHIGTINPEITRIILTGYATMEAAIEATNAGIDGFLTKPFDNVELRAKIHDIWVRKHLRQFICEQIYQEIQKNPGALTPSYRDVTILFSDIRNFTRMSQQVSPQELVDFLNNYYFTPMGDIAYRFRGTLDKHIGDSMMVVFGSPVPQANASLRAVRAAIQMQAKALELARELRTNARFRLEIGIGMAYGKVFSGIMGSLRKKEFTSVGMAVNIAARLQGLARAGEILVDEPLYHQVRGEIDAEALPPTTVKGVDDPLQVYRIGAGAGPHGDW